MHMAPDAGGNVSFTCADCEACCCRLEVMLAGDDDVPAHYAATDRWGGEVMARLDDGWCAALGDAYDRTALHPWRFGGEENLQDLIAGGT
jgi:Fe-S-cluster containining protein